MFFLMLLMAIQAAFAPPAQADWLVGSQLKLTVALQPKTTALGMDGSFDASVRISSANEVGIDPNITFTRGLAIQVLTMDGKPVSPVVPPAGSPPNPPVFDPARLTKVGPAKPLTLEVEEPSLTIFPGAGRYRVRAVVSVFDWRHKPVRYKSFASPAATIDVNEHG